MRDRREILSICLAGFVAIVPPVSAQTIRQIPLNVATGEIDRTFLPAGERFDFLIRASSELREFRGQYRAGAGEAVIIDPWVRKDPTQSKDATLRVARLQPGTSYHFVFTFVRRPTGNEGRLIETRAQDILRDEFRAAPDQPIEAIVSSVAPKLAAALDTILPRAVAAELSPLAGQSIPVGAALAARGIDVVQADYRRAVTTVERLVVEFRTARDFLSRAAIFSQAVDAIGSAVARRGGYAELAAPLDACRSVAGGTIFRDPGPVGAESAQLAILLGLKAYDAAAGLCLGLLRDVRLPRYSDLAVKGTAAVSDLFTPVASRLEALRGETERLLSLGRKRDGALGQAAGDIRRGLDLGVTLTTTVETSFSTAPVFDLSGVSFGVGLVGAHVPCSATGSCLRIVPDATVSLRLMEPLSAEIGLTLASIEREGRTKNLFWFSNALVGLSVRLGDRAQRLSAGAIVLRRDEPGRNGGFSVGWYFGLTVFDFRI